MESRLRASRKQFTLMIEFMERHGDLSRPQPGLQGRIRVEHLWHELADLLNSMSESGVNKTAEKWKRVWSDWKTKTKKKSSTMKRHLSNTTGGSAKGKPLNLLEKRVMRVIGSTSKTGLNISQEAGFEVPEVKWVPSTMDEIELKLPPPPILDHADYTLAPAKYTFASSQPAPNTSVPGSSVRIKEEARTPASCPPTGISRRQTPFYRVMSNFVALEQSRFRLEQKRDARLFQLEGERCRIESERLRIDAQRVQLDQERARVEVERLRVEEDRVRIESERIQHISALQETAQQLNTKVTALLSRLENIFEDTNHVNRPKN